MVRMSKAVTAIDLSIGRVTYQRRCHSEAPSTRAASITSPGMAARPAANNRMTIGV